MDDVARGPRDLVGIGVAARRFGIAESALRCWEARGLIKPARSSTERRLYGPDELHRIGLIQMWRESGLMSLDEIANVLSTRDHSWRQEVRGRLAAIERQQRRLTDARAHLEYLLSCPDEDPAEECPYLRAMTAEAQSPPGQA